MAYTQDGRYYDENLQYEIRPNVIMNKFERKTINEDFSLNFRINEEVLKKFSEYCKQQNTTKSKMFKKVLTDFINGDIKITSFKKYNELSNKNVHFLLKSSLYKQFVEKCHEKDLEEPSGVMRKLIVYAYSKEAEEDSKTGE